ncbi:coagulation factor XI-like isoform X2 [Trematomus bernacchii]|uniref:coagulation factor XI-like isoform X2 n=1 Tax=Trematomus bernacchii TaxID=40690 RepID=UPI00146C7924|nr:coagulation factor XI-like isoform X2 [Trematomus bernacchii]
METHLILVGLLSLCSLSLSQVCNTQLLENVDFPGMDIKFEYSPDADHCQQLCTQHPSCLFFTFIRPDWTKDLSHFYYCYLKTTTSGNVPVQKPLKGVTSGFSLKACTPELQPCLPNVYPGVDFFGADYTALFTADHEECQRACTQDPGCQFFTFLHEDFGTENIRFKCYLKYSPSIPAPLTVRRETGVVSGFSQNVRLPQQSTTACEGKLFPSISVPQSNLKTLPGVCPDHCRALCSAHPACTFFSFDSNEFKCHLKNNRDKMETIAKEGSTTGFPERFCQLDENWLKVAHDGVDLRGSDICFELMDDADSCQRNCTEDPLCQFYTYVTEAFHNRDFRRRCYFKRTITMPAPPKITKLEKVTSGFQLRSCVETASHTRRVDVSSTV